MARKLRIDAEINVAVDASTKSLDKVKNDLMLINKGFPGIGDATVKKLEQVALDVSKVKKGALQDLASGAITNPDVLNKYIADVNKQEVALRKVTDETIKRIANDKKVNAEVNNATQAIQAQERVLKSKEQTLDSIRQKTKAVTKMEQEVSRSTGVSVSTLQDPSKIQAEIRKRQSASGQPLNDQSRKEIAEFEKLLKLRQQIEAQDKDILANQQKIESEIEQQNIDLEKAKQHRREILNKAIDIKEAEYKRTKGLKGINKEQATQLRHLVAQDKELGDIGKKLKTISYKKQSQEINENIKANQKFNKTLKEGKKGFLQNVTAATVYYAALRAVRQIIRSVTKTVTDLDKSFTEIAMVTNLNRKEAWGLVDGYQNLAKEVGTTTSEVAKLAVFFARQGRSASDAFQLTKVAAMAAKVASIDATESANFLTAAINGFGLAIDQAMDVSDKFAALGASSASSYQEMAVALSKVAPSAKVAGVNIDQMLGFLAKGIETTREAPENIGTAFKTVFARMTQLRDFGKTLEEGVAVNTVEEALATAGVALRDNQGNFRAMGDVLTELGYKFEGLTRNQQAYIATALAGTRQQSRLLAVLQDFDRTMQLVEVSMGASGATLAQHAEYADGMEAANARLQTSWQQVIIGFVEADSVIKIVETLGKGLSFLAGSVGFLAPAFLTLAVAVGLYKVATIGATVAKTIYNAISLKGIAIQALDTGAKVINTAATLTLAGATMTLGTAIVIATGGIILIVGAIIGLISWISKLPSATEKSTEKIKEFKVEMYNANKEVKELGNLVDTFDELDKKVFKTAEDLKEMDNILQKIAEYGGDENMFVVGGQIDRKAVDDYLKGQQEIADAAQEGIRNEGRQNLTRMQRGVEQTPETRASIIEYLASSTAGFDQLDKAVQDRIRVAISQDVEGYAEAFKKTEKVVARSGSSYIKTSYENTIRPEAEKMLKDFNGLFTGELEGDAAAELFEEYTLLTASEKKMIEDAYANQLGDILLVGEEVIDNFLNRGYNLGQIASLVASVEDALSGLSAGFYFGNSQGGGFMETANASDVADFYAETLSTLDPSDPNSNAQALNATIQYIEELGLSAADTQKYVKQLTDVLTDPMAFKTGMNEVRRATSSIEALMDASKSMGDGKLPDNLETLIETYPQLAGQLRDGTLTMSEAYNAVASGLSDTLTGKLNALYSQLATASELEKNAIQAQIDILEYYKNNPQLLMNEDGMVDEAVKEMEDRYKSEIDFIKSLNSARKEEIDLMQRKLEVNKSMLDIDRQISALSRDTSYGAQARLRDLRENQANQALEREKFIMDLITEQAISQLEEESRQAVLDINENVQVIVDALTKPSSPTNRTADTIRQALGLTLQEI
jgi:TP901 family phage tail tape measure protein